MASEKLDVLGKSILDLRSPPTTKGSNLSGFIELLNPIEHRSVCFVFGEQLLAYDPVEFGLWLSTTPGARGVRAQ